MNNPKENSGGASVRVVGSPAGDGPPSGPRSRHECIVHDGFEQGSEEWIAWRVGRITASNFGAVMAKGSGSTRKSYALKVAAQRITGLPGESYTNAAMEWGTLNEPAARAEYELTVRDDIRTVGGVELLGGRAWTIGDRLANAVTCSPDGLVGHDGLIEIKCPNTTTHIETVATGKISTAYRRQIMGNLWITGRDWCDFVSFDPRVPGPKCLHVIRVERDDDEIAELMGSVETFAQEVENYVEMMRAA